jgi:hypothetical protein
MELITYQRKLAGLIKGTYFPVEEDDTHLKSIASSENLVMTREIIIWWRQLSLERYCRLTTAALKQLGIFDVETQRFITHWDFSPYVEEVSQQFLEDLKSHKLALVASLANFESALIRVTQGSSAVTIIKWQHDPYAVLDAVTTGSGLHLIKATGNYETQVSADLPGLFIVTPKVKQKVNQKIKQKRELTPPETKVH